MTNMHAHPAVIFVVEKIIAVRDVVLSRFLPERTVAPCAVRIVNKQPIKLRQPLFQLGKRCVEFVIGKIAISQIAADLLEGQLCLEKGVIRLAHLRKRQVNRLALGIFNRALPGEIQRSRIGRDASCQQNKQKERQTAPERRIQRQNADKLFFLRHDGHLLRILPALH